MPYFFEDVEDDETRRRDEVMSLLEYNRGVPPNSYLGFGEEIIKGINLN